MRKCMLADTFFETIVLYVPKALKMCMSYSFNKLTPRTTTLFLGSKINYAF